uniref:Uncharacterized protein n=1 Tax=Rhizophora mucronata TaxID=61149 RepID=A0A2P2Q8S8_RHIMU
MKSESQALQSDDNFNIRE